MPGLDCSTFLNLSNGISMSQTTRTLQETLTTLAPAETLQAAKQFFARQNGVYAAFPEQESPQHLTLRGQGGEEIIIGVTPVAGGTRVTGSTYLFDQQLARFFATLSGLAVAADTGGVS
jgi:hypothetical protein